MIGLSRSNSRNERNNMSIDDSIYMLAASLIIATTLALGACGSDDPGEGEASAYHGWQQ